MEKKTITLADTLPITLDELATWCRIDDAEEEALLLQDLISAARDTAENFTGRTLRSGQVEYLFPARLQSVSIPTSPVRGIVSVEAEAEDGTRTGLIEGQDYRQRLTDFISYVRLIKGRSEQVLVVTADIGFESSTDIPKPIKQAIAIHAASAYKGREGQDEAKAQFEALLRPYCLGVL